ETDSTASGDGQRRKCLPAVGALDRAHGWRAECCVDYSFRGHRRCDSSQRTTGNGTDGAGGQVRPCAHLSLSAALRLQAVWLLGNICLVSCGGWLLRIVAAEWAGTY